VVGRGELARVVARVVAEVVIGGGGRVWGHSGTGLGKEGRGLGVIKGCNTFSFAISLIWHLGTFTFFSWL